MLRVAASGVAGMQQTSTHSGKPLATGHGSTAGSASYAEKSAGADILANQRIGRIYLFYYKALQV